MTKATVAPRIAYHPGASLLHRLHPLVKLGWLVFGTALVFILRAPWISLGTLALALLGFWRARLPLGELRGTRLFVVSALLLGALQVLLVDEGAVLARMGPLTVTAEGVAGGLYVAARFLSVVLLSYLFVLTTDPNDLAYAAMQAGLPYRYGFALTTALRLVAVFEQEGRTVYNAQRARGVQYDVRSPRRLFLLVRQFLLPMLISALGKVDALAVSMEGRCFGKYPDRTFLHEVHPRRADAVALALLALGVVGTLIILVI
jgi:energy-coupling factor transport system permease protein